MDLMSLVPDRPPWAEDLISPRISHNCEVQKEEDEIESLVKGTRIIDKIRRWAIRKSILSRGHPIIRSCIKSSAAVNYEISRHIRTHRCMIYPFSQIRSIWETLMTVFTIVALILVPFFLAFHFDRPEDFFYLTLAIDIVFIVDIALWFFTGHFDNSARIVILDRKIVAGKYLRGFFTCDLLSAIPVEVFHVIVVGKGNVKWYSTVMNLTKIFRLRNVIFYSRRLTPLYGISFQMYKIFEMTTIIVVCIHWAACLEFYVALVAGEIAEGTAKDRGSWLASVGMQDKDTKFRKYLACLNRAMISLAASTHYRDVKTPEDVVLNMLLTVVGRMIGFVYILVQFLQLMTTFRSTSKKNVRRVEQLQEYMRYKELPYAIQRRLLDYCNYCNKKSFDRDKSIIDNVSPHLREELLLHNFSRLIDNVDVFQYLPQRVIAQIVGLLRTKIYLTNDAIVKSSETSGDALYFVAAGTIAIYTKTGKEVCHLEDGSHFGDVALVMENQQRFAKVIAVETCEIWTLRRVDFLPCIKSYPRILNRLRKLAIERLEKRHFAEE